jgi:Peptidase family M1 domain
MKKYNFSAAFVFVLCVIFSVQAQDPTPSPTPEVVGEVVITTKFANSDPLYKKIRQGLTDKKLSDECAVVNNVVLQKDVATFALTSGELYFLAPIEGRMTGAVFIGQGEMSFTPPVETEQKHLAMISGASEIKEQFSQMVMYFSDRTYNAIKNSVNTKMTTGCSQTSKAQSLFQEKADLLKRRFRFNMSSRLLADFMTPKRNGFFTAFVDGKKNGELLFQIDPIGITDVYPEQVALISYADTTRGIWTAFHLKNEYAKGTANSWTDRRIYDITHHDIETTVDGTKLRSKDTVTLQMREPDNRFIAFDLFRTLRVKTVTDESGNELSYIQEKKDEDADFGVILDKAPEVGKPFKVIVEYEGDGALLKAGTGNFYLLPRSTWYPNNPFTAFADRATFNLTFRYPKKYVMVGVGNRVGEDTLEGDTKTSKWTTDDVEFEVAGFNYGDFKMTKSSDAASGYDLEVYANRELPDFMKEYQMASQRAEEAGITTGQTLGAMTTTDGSNKVLDEAQNSMRLYNAFFGKLPYKRFAMTQQPAGNFGQAWTTLVFMPYTAYISKAQRVQFMGMRGGTSDFWSEVGPHELAHQWWGHIVGWTSYHDQWMSEGFSELSTSIYVQYVEKDINKFIKYWEDQRKMIVEPSPATKGLKPFSVGPLTQGYRLNSAKTGNVARYMIYPKGAYVLHMLRMMMYDHKGKTGDAAFTTMMKDFIKTNYNKPVSTNDFKQAVDRNITPEMDVDKNKSMSWFFDEWVYGTEMPSYKFEYNVTGNKLTGSITQSNVSKNFIMLIPIYADFGTGWQFLGKVSLAGNDTLDIGTINLPRAPKKIAIAALNDVLAEKIENVKK